MKTKKLIKDLSRLEKIIISEIAKNKLKGGNIGTINNSTKTNGGILILGVLDN